MDEPNPSGSPDLLPAQPETAAKVSDMYGLTPAALSENPDGDFRTKLIADFYRMHVPHLLADAGFCAALDPLQQLQKEHLHRAERGQGKLSGLVSHWRKEQQDPGELLDGLMRFVPFLAALAVRRNAGKGGWENLWTIDTGKTWKSLREFPRRLRRIADEVERLNRSPFFCPEHAITAKTPSANFAKTQFTRLPAHLNIYASWIEVWTSKLPAYMGADARGPRGFGQFVYSLSLMISILTGRFCDEEASTLLNAADLALNPESLKSEPRFHPQTLADIRSRLRRKAPKT